MTWITTVIRSPTTIVPVFNATLSMDWVDVKAAKKGMIASIDNVDIPTL